MIVSLKQDIDLSPGAIISQLSPSVRVASRRSKGDQVDLSIANVKTSVGSSRIQSPGNYTYHACITIHNP